MKALRITINLIVLFLTIFINACTKDLMGGGSATGVWQRYESPKGYNTDLAVGNIPGEPANRVYMCEHPGSPSAGLYKGYIYDDIITWDAIYGLSNAEFKEVGSERTLYFGVGDVATKYKRGIWTNTCGELKYTAKNIYYRWTTGSTCSMPAAYTLTYNHPDLPSSLIKNQQYGPISAGSIEITLNFINGSNSSNITVSEPPSGYRRIYTQTVYSYDSSLNRCLIYLSNPKLTFVDQPL